MFKLIVVPFACAFLMLLGNQTWAQDPKSDNETLKAELTRAKAEILTLQKELAKTKGDLDLLRTLHSQVKGPPSKAPPADVQEELLKRWNAVAADRSFDVPGFGKINFKWTAFGDFPHPTFRGGSAEAYGAFAQVLVAFFEKGDNFDYLGKHDLFTADLPIAIPGGSKKGPGWSLAAFAREFSGEKPFAKLNADTAKAIRELSERIEKKSKK